MNYITAPFFGLLKSLLSLTAPLLVLLALPFVKWDDEPTTGSYGIGSVIRGDLPDWLSWLRTPDERLPGGLYEAEHLALYEKYGKWVASWFWLGVRNRMIGMSVAFGHETTDYSPDTLGWWERGDVWRYSFKIGVIKVLMGYKIYRLLDGRFWAASSFSVMVRK